MVNEVLVFTIIFYSNSFSETANPFQEGFYELNVKFSEHRICKRKQKIAIAAISLALKTQKTLFLPFHCLEVPLEKLPRPFKTFLKINGQHCSFCWSAFFPPRVTPIINFYFYPNHNKFSKTLLKKFRNLGLKKSISGVLKVRTNRNIQSRRKCFTPKQITQFSVLNHLRFRFSQIIPSSLKFLLLADDGSWEKFIMNAI